MTTRISLSPDFADLKLQFASDAGLRYTFQPLYDFCSANRIDTAILSHPDFARAAIGHWYILHRQSGGPPDSAAEVVVAELNERDVED